LSTDRIVSSRKLPWLKDGVTILSFSDITVEYLQRRLAQSRKP
jgi:hypothetical protein